MKLVQVDKEDTSDWDQYVSNIETSHFMQSYSWGQLKKQTGWNPIYLKVVENEKMRGAALLLTKRLPLINRYIYYLPRGPVVDFNDNEAFLFLMNNIKLFVKDNNGIFLRVDPYLKKNDENNLLFEQTGFKRSKKKWSFWNNPRFVFWLNLESDSKILLMRLHKKARNEIRFPHKRGVEFSLANISDIDDFYSLMIGTAEQKGIGFHDKNYYRKLYKTLGDTGMAQLFMARHEGRAIATGMSLVYGKRAWLMYLASSKKHFHFRPNRALQWEMIKWAKEKGCTVYDFRGTAADDPPDPKDPGYGVYKFKKSFGPEYIKLVEYYDYVVNRPIYLLFGFVENYLFPLMVKGMLILPKLKRLLGRSKKS